MFLKIQKRTLSFLLALILVLSVFMSVAVFPASADEANYGVKFDSENPEVVYSTLKEAIAAATGHNGAVITALQDVEYGTGVDNNLTIPSGVTLLIPFDADHTVYRAKAGVSHIGDAEPKLIYDYTMPFSFCTMTMKSNSKLFVDAGGEISVSSQLSSYGSTAEANNANGCPTGPGGRIKMEGNSEIVVNGGTLYAWGYIYRAGDGSEGAVTVNSGTVYEAFQITNYRGFDDSLYAAQNGSFPFNQYYVQNIEVPMTLKYGAKEVGIAALNKGSGLLVPIDVEFIGDKGLFVMSDENSCVVKDYLEDDDRLKVEISGDSQLSSLSMQLGSNPLDSSWFPLPITNNISVEVKENANLVILQDISMLPGTEIKVDEDAKMTIAKDAEIYLCDVDQWEQNSYVDTSTSTNYIPVKYSAASSKQDGAPADRFKEDETLESAKVDINGEVVVNGGFYSPRSTSNQLGITEANVISSKGTGKITYSTAASVNSSLSECSGGSDVVSVGYFAAGLRVPDPENPTGYVYALPITLTNESIAFVSGTGTFETISDNETGEDVNGTAVYFWDYTPIVDKHSLSLDGDIVVHFYHQFSSDSSYDPSKVTAEFSWGNEYIEGSSYSYSDTPKSLENVTSDTHSSDRFYRFSLPIAVKELNDEITVKYWYEGKDEPIATHKYRASDYAYQVLSMTDGECAALLDKNQPQQTAASLKELARTMLIYAAEAQKTFKYKTDSLATSQLGSGDYSKYSTAVDPVNTDDLVQNDLRDLPDFLEYYGSSLNLGSKTAYDLCFINESKTAFDHNANYSEGGEDVRTDVRFADTAYVVRLCDLPAAKITESISLNINGSYVTVNAGDYIYKVVTTRSQSDALFKTVTALYAYNQSAVAFFFGN